MELVFLKRIIALMCCKTSVRLMLIVVVKSAQVDQSAILAQSVQIAKAVFALMELVFHRQTIALMQ